MRKYIFNSLLLSASFLIVSSCTRDNRSENRESVPSEYSEELREEEPSFNLPYTTGLDENGEIIAVENPEFDPANTEVDYLLGSIERIYPEINLEVQEISRDTLFLRIPDASFLTQRMGSMGARSYLMEVTYALTTLPDVQVVHFDFTEGDHAGPGSYTRQSFNSQLISP